MSMVLRTIVCIFAALVGVEAASFRNLLGKTQAGMACNQDGRSTECDVGLECIDFNDGYGWDWTLYRCAEQLEAGEQCDHAETTGKNALGLYRQKCVEGEYCHKNAGTVLDPDMCTATLSLGFNCNGNDDECGAGYCTFTRSTETWGLCTVKIANDQPCDYDGYYSEGEGTGKSGSNTACESGYCEESTCSKDPATQFLEAVAGLAVGIIILILCLGCCCCTACGGAVVFFLHKKSSAKVGSNS